MLGFFKYFNFFIDNLHGVLASAGLRLDLPVLRVLLPVGISFYTFQAMSYTVDVAGLPPSAAGWASAGRSWA